MVGESLGPYEILEPLGKGGMGEVYLAEDKRLDRKVAVKLLPEEFAADPERLARLRREARLLAQLEHPNVAAVYGLEEDGDATFLVMQYAEGRTLASILADGPLDVESALGVALQIAEALEAAHERGVVHRDLKPGNVHVTFDADRRAAVKVLDFGLAKLYLPDDTDAELSPEITGSPTVMATRAGVILGTAAYMSPEQARGGAVDKRTDIWAFGCVLYEMLTGHRAFDGETVTDVIAAIVKDDPEWSKLPEQIPGTVDGLLRRCLVKSSRQRLRDIGEARILLERTLGDGRGATAVGSAAGSDASAALPAVSRLTGRAADPRVAWTVAVVMTLLVAVAGWMLLWSPPPDPPLGARFTVMAPADAPLVLAPFGSSVQISPDGTRLVFVGRGPFGVAGQGTWQLYVRPLDSLEARPIPGTGDGIAPFFSPDGRRIGFFTRESLRTVELDGSSPPRTLTSTRGPRGATWGPDGTIVYAEWPGDGGLLQVAEAGGDPEPLTELDASTDEISHRHPEFVPGGRFVLFTILRGRVSSRDDLAVGIFDRESGETKILLEGALHARHAATGHLVYAVPPSGEGRFVPTGTGARLMAVPFDAGAGRIVGDPVPMVEGINAVPLFGTADFAISRSGALAFVPDTGVIEIGISAGVAAPLVWVQEDGSVEPFLPPASYTQARFSPDGGSVLLVMPGSGSTGLDVWIQDVGSDTPERLTFDGISGPAAWTPDGEGITFAPTQGGIYTMPSDRSEPPEELVPAGSLPPWTWPVCWDPTGRRRLLISSTPMETGSDVSVVEIDEDGAQVLPLAATPARGGVQPIRSRRLSIIDLSGGRQRRAPAPGRRARAPGRRTRHLPEPGCPRRGGPRSRHRYARRARSGVDRTRPQRRKTSAPNEPLTSTSTSSTREPGHGSPSNVRARRCGSASPSISR